MRSISRWVAPPLSSVQMVVCRCGFKTFTPLFPRSEGVEINVLPVGLRGARRTVFNASDHRGQGGAVWVAISGALWVAAGACILREALVVTFCTEIKWTPLTATAVCDMQTRAESASA